MTASLYKTLDGKEITVDQVFSACFEVAMAINGALLIMRACGQNDDDDIVALCNAMTVILKHIDHQVDGIYPARFPD